MKLVLLFDGSKKDFLAIENLYNNYNACFLDVCNIGANSDCEYHCISKAIRELSDSGCELLVVRYSGSLDVTQEIGDESSEMVIPVAFNGNTHCSLNSEKFEELVSMFI